MTLPARVPAWPTSVSFPTFGPLLTDVAKAKGTSEQEVRTEFLAYLVTAKPLSDGEEGK